MYGKLEIYNLNILIENRCKTTRDKKNSSCPLLRFFFVMSLSLSVLLPSHVFSTTSKNLKMQNHHSDWFKVSRVISHAKVLQESETVHGCGVKEERKNIIN
jgi:hypothetical protein